MCGRPGNGWDGLERGGWIRHPVARRHARVLNRRWGDLPRPSTACNDPNESVVVAAAPAPSITVAKSAAPPSLPEPGGSFTFRSW